MVHSLTSLVLVLVVLVLLGLTFVAWRHRTKPGAKIFGVLQVLSIIWVIPAIVGLQLPPGRLRVQLWGFNTGMSLIVVVFWLAFILIYTGRDRYMRLDRIGIVSAPLAFGAGLYFVVPRWPPLVVQVHQATISAGTVVRSSVGPLGGVLGVYIYLVFLVGTGLVVKKMFEGNSLFVGQALALVLGSLVTFLASFLDILGVPVVGYPMTEVSILGQSLLWGYAVFGQQFLRVMPAVGTIGERAVFDELDDAVVVVDNDGTITRANTTARSTLDAAAMVGGTVTDLCDRFGVSGLADLPVRFQYEGQTYRATTSYVTNWRGRSIGQTLLIQDVTSLLRRQQRLQVLNRILRHNVRNDMQVVMGLGDHLQDREEPALTEIGATVEEKADDLMTVSDKALQLDKLLDSPNTETSVALDEVVRDITASLASEYPDAAVTTDISAVEMRSDPSILSLLVEEVIANALEHSGETPEIDIAVSYDGEQVLITVADNGPGIPAMEIDPIRSGEETDLAHATSLGLWLIHWGTQSLGGEIAFDSGEDGSTVSITLPATEPAGGPRSQQELADPTAGKSG
jgi:two-component sensor histidine kinase